MKPDTRLPETIKHTIKIDIDPKAWVYVSQAERFVKTGQEYGSMPWQNALAKVQRETPFVVTPLATFTSHFTNVCHAVRKKNPTTLYNGAGEPLTKSARDNLYSLLTVDTLIWLDAYFAQRKEGLYVLTDHRTVKGQLLQPQTQEPLEMRVHGYRVLVDLQWNRQGLPVKKSRPQSYVRGKNIYFSEPQANAVAVFDAGPGGAILGYNMSTQSPLARLGVLLCAEGVAKK